MAMGANSSAGEMYSQRYNTDGAYHAGALKQWAQRVISYSTQYNNAGWSANQILGEPRVFPQHGDIQGAWATSVNDNRQFIEVEFGEPVRPKSIHIYETYNPGAVIKVKAREAGGQWILVWNTDHPTHLTQSRIFSPPLSNPVKMMKINQVRIEIDCTSARSWCELDAVQLVGVRIGTVDPIDDTQFIDDMKLLVNNQLHSDVQFNIDDKRVYGHKSILATRSPFFARLFDTKGNENQTKLKLPDIHHEDMIAVLQFLYTNRLTPDCSLERLAILCKASGTFEVPELKTAAMHGIVGRLACNNVVQVYHRTHDDAALDDLRNLCMTFMASHLKEMSKEPSFEKLPQSVIVTVVQEATMALCLNDS